MVNLLSQGAKLAVPLSIAARIEPELIRAIRLAVLPRLDVSAESDLWFDDDLVASRGPDDIVLKPEVLPGLRARLAEEFAHSGPDDPIRSVWDITARVHASTSPALVLEEKVAWLAATAGDPGRTAIEDELCGALYALRVQGRTGVADWLVGAWPRLPESVRRTKTAWQLRQAASVHIDTSGLPVGIVPDDIGVADLADFVGDLPDVLVAVRLAGGELEIGDIGAPPGAAAVPLPDTNPRIVELLRGNGDAGTNIAVPAAGMVSIPAGPGPVELLSPRGLLYQVTPYQPPRALVPLLGSERQPLTSAAPAGELNMNTNVGITLVLRRRGELPAYMSSYVTPKELAERYGADPADIALVEDVLSDFGLTVTSVQAAARLVAVSGSLATLAAAFGTSLRQVTSEAPDGGGRVAHRYREGILMIPAHLAGVVTAVLGLDDRPQALLCARLAGQHTDALTAPQVADLCYAFPPGSDGTGQTLASIEFGVVLPVDADAYFSGLGLATPRPRRSTVYDAVSGEGMPVSVALSGAVAPGAIHHVYFAPNTDRGFVAAISEAIHATPTPTAITIGWGRAEDAWTPQSRMAIDQALSDAAALGITVCVAAGDGGSESGWGDGLSHVFFPASSPYALACGGTTLAADVASGTIASEVVWRSTGGGVSDAFALPSWQANAGVPVHADGGQTGRGVPDVAANADPETGYLMVVDGVYSPVGGTALVAALWSALICRLAQGLGRNLGHLQPIIYLGTAPGVTPSGFRPIVSGNNGAYRAGPGWDACTGLGSPVGTELLRVLAEQPP